MGLLAALRPGIGAAHLSAAATLLDPVLGPLGVASPWAGAGNLESIVLADIFGDALPTTVTRAQAMRVPAVARARHIIAGTIARIELGAYRGDDRLDAAGGAPTWLTATDGAVSPFHRMLWTADDLLFYGWSLWRITKRYADSTGSYPARLERVPMGQWQLEPETNRVLTYQSDGNGGWALRVAPQSTVVLIPGPHEGLLVEGAPAVRHGRDLQRAAHNAARFPSAYLGLRQTSGAPLKRSSADPTEVTVETLLAEWRAARHNPDGGGVAWLGGVEVQEIGSFAAHLNPEGRNAAAVDIARHASIPADLIDATISDSSLHYSTSRDNDRRGIDYGFGAYMAAISGRLSLDDVCPRGQRIAFDLERWLKGEGVAPGQPAKPAPGLATQQPTTTDGETPQ